MAKIKVKNVSILILSFLCLFFYGTSQEKNRINASLQTSFNEVSNDAQDLLTMNKQLMNFIEAYEVRISDLEKQLAYDE